MIRLFPQNLKATAKPTRLKTAATRFEILCCQMLVSNTLQKTAVNMAMREEVGYSIRNVCFPTSLSPMTSLKSCACEVVMNKPKLHAMERSASGVIVVLLPEPRIYFSALFKPAKRIVY